MMTCIIIEDQPPAQRILKKYIEDIGTLKLLETFNEATKSMEFLKTHEVDIVFLDIHLPKISGIEFLKILPYTPNVILTTAFSEYALESYELNVVDYLLKPFSFQRFVQAVSKVSIRSGDNNINDQEIAYSREIFLKSGYEHIKLDVSDIRYIKSDADYTEIYINDKKHLSSEPLRFWKDFLDPNQFVRVHKSYIIIRVCRKK